MINFIENALISVSIAGWLLLGVVMWWRWGGGLKGEADPMVWAWTKLFGTSQETQSETPPAGTAAGE